MNTPFNPPPADDWILPAESTPDDDAGPPSRSRLGIAAKAAGVLAAAGLVAAGVVFVVQRHSGSPTASAASGSGAPPAAAAGGLPGLGGGGVQGEQRIQGTVTARTATSVTVKTVDGTATYAVNATSEIIRNGQRATLADVQVGDPVLVHVFPSASGQLLVERLFAGSSASGAGPRGFGRPPRAPGTITS